MWELWIQATKFSKLPSEVFEPDEMEWRSGGTYGSVLRWCFNSAVTWFGITIENALQERVKVGYGNNVTSQPKYTLARLLHPQFRLPRPLPEVVNNVNPWSPLLAWMGHKNGLIKKYAYVPPPEEKVM